MSELLAVNLSPSLTSVLRLKLPLLPMIEMGGGGRGGVC